MMFAKQKSLMACNAICVVSFVMRVVRKVKGCHFGIVANVLWMRKIQRKILCCNAYCIVMM